MAPKFWHLPKFWLFREIYKAVSRTREIKLLSLTYTAQDAQDVSTLNVLVPTSWRLDL